MPCVHGARGYDRRADRAWPQVCAACDRIRSAGAQVRRGYRPHDARYRVWRVGASAQPRDDGDALGGRRRRAARASIGDGVCSPPTPTRGSKHHVCRLPSARRSRRRAQPRARALAYRAYVSRGTTRGVAGARHRVRNVRVRARPGRGRCAVALRHARGTRRTSERRRDGRAVRRTTTSRARTRMRSALRASRWSALSLPGVHEDALALVDAGVRAADASRARSIVPAPRSLRARRALRCRRVRALRCDLGSGMQSARRPHDGNAGRRRRDGHVQRDGRVDRRRASSRPARGDTGGRATHCRCGRRAGAHGAGCGRRHSRTKSRASEQGGRHHDDRGEGARRDGQRRPAADQRLAGGRTAARGVGPVSHGHAILLAGIDDGDGCRRRAAS